MHSPKPTPVHRITAALPMLLALSLTACATHSPTPATAAAPTLPAPPPLTEPAPSQSYSEAVRALLKTWREKLTGTPATP